MIGIYVNNCLIIVKDESILKLIVEFKMHEFKLKIEKKIVDYLRCHIVKAEMKNKIVMIHTHLISCLDQKLNEKSRKKGNYKGD